MEENKLPEAKQETKKGKGMNRRASLASKECCGGRAVEGEEGRR